MMLASWAVLLVLLVLACVTGRAVTRLAGSPAWNGLEPAAGLAVVLTLGVVLARLSGRALPLGLGLAALLAVSLAILRRSGRSDLPDPEPGLALTLAVVLAMAHVPFAVAGHWGELGPAGREGALGPDVFTGLLLATAVICAWTAWHAVDRLDGWKRPLAAIPAATPYLLVAFYVEGALKEPAVAVFVIAFVVAADRGLGAIREGSWSRSRLLVPGLLTVAAVAVSGFALDLYGAAGAGSGGAASPVEGLGVWLNPEYRASAASSTLLPDLLGVVGVAGLLVALWWWVVGPRSVWPAVLAGTGAAYLLSLLAGEAAPARVMAVASPAVMVVVLIPLLAGPASGWKPQQGMEFGGWVSLATLFLIGTVASSLLVLANAPVT